MNKSSSNKDAILAITLLFLLFFLAFHQLFFIYLAISIILLSFLWQGFSNAAEKIWNFAGEAIGRVSGTIILTVLFFVVVFPMGLALKLFGKDPLQLKQPKTETNFQIFKKRIVKTDLQNPY